MKFKSITAIAMGILLLTGSAVYADGCGAAKVAQKDIVDTAISAGTFKTLVAAVTAADLAGTLKGEGPFTVLAPTDEAFAKLPAGTIEALLADKKKLAEILTYHVIAGNVEASEVVRKASLRTLQGQKIRVSTKNGVMLGAANVLTADIKTSNGVIHVIDQVLIPN